MSTSGGKAKITKEDGFTVTTIPDGYEWVTDDDGNTTLQPGDYQAFIKYGTKWTYFKTLQDAVNEAADDGKTVIWLNKDIDNFEGIEITRSLIINFNSHTITGASGVSVLKITGATVKLTADSKGVGGINGGSNGDNRAIWVGKDADVTIERGTYTVGGDASGLGNSTILVTDNGKVTIKGGTFSSEKPHDGKYYVLDLQNGCAGTITVKGGKFLNFDPIKGDDHDGGNFCGTNTGITKNSEGYYVAQASMSIQIVDADGGSVKAYTAKKAATAFADVQDGQTIKLLQDTSVSAALTIDADKKVTLDLNGKKLSTSYRADDPTKHYYAIDNYGTFTLKDSSAEQSGEIRARGIENLEGGTMVIESGKIVAIDTNGGAAIWNEANTTLTILGGTFETEYEGTSGDEYGPGCVYSKGTLTISGGTFTSVNKRTYAVISESGTVTITPAEGKNVTISGAHGGVGINGGKATINGGSYGSSDYYGLYVSNDAETAAVTVNGGTFNGKEYSVLIGSDGPQDVTSKLTIKGGTFSKPIHAQENTGTGAIQVSGGTFSDPVDPAYCANGFIPTSSTTADGKTTYGVVKGSYVASVTTADGAETEYATLQAAVAAAKDGEIVKLLGDVTLDATLIVKEKTLTLDLNGKTITNEKDLWNEANYTWSLISVRDNGNLTIKDSVGTGKLKAKANDCFALDVYAYNKANAETTTLTIESGEYIGNSSAIYAFVGKVTINGGHFSIQQLSSSNDYRFMLNCYDESHTAGTAGFTVNGGTFDHFDPRNNLAEGTGTSFVAEGVGVDANSDGTFTAKPHMIAQIIDAKGNSKMACTTLQEAVKAVGETNTIKLLANTKENVTISKPRVTLDLNGYTLNGGTEKGKPALTVTAMNTVVKDSSTAHTGTIKREDTAENSGISSHYVIDVQGKSLLTFESGNVVNNSGNGQNAKGAALVRVGSDSVKKYPGLTIKGGTFTQDNFIVIKVERGNFSLNGGTLSSKNYAIQNWHHATIKGGTVNGLASSWTYGSLASDLTISSGTVNGDVYSVNYNNAAPAAKVAINGGTVNGKMYTYVYDENAGKLNQTNDATKATIEVTGGTFSQDPSKYVVESAAATKNDDGSYSVAEAYLASVGGTSYYTMKEAVEAQTASGKDIVLLRDYTTGSPFRSGISARVVDLNKHTWTCTGTGANSAAFEISNPNASLTVKNGKIVSSQLVGLIPSAMGGTIMYDDSSLTFDGVEMSTTATSGIETNGNNKDDNVTLRNSTLNVPNGFGIYFPSSGTLTIDNSTINAKTMGVQLCAGSLSINEGSTITVSGDAVPKTESDGAIQDGAAISIVNRSGYKGLGTIAVTGGKFTAKTGNDAIKAYDYEKMIVSEFTKPETVSVSGGTFSSPVDEALCKDGYIPTTGEGGTYGVKLGSYVAEVDGKKYESLQAAIDAADANATVKLLADTTEDVTISKNITLDLGDKTLTNDNSNASQSTLTIAAGATATVKNGSIIGGNGWYNIAVGTKAQPGGELTLENVTATAGNTGSSMIDNHGSLTITSGTYTGGLDTVKNEPNATLNISGGTFTLTKGNSDGFTAVVFNYGELTITGGEFIQSDKNAPYGQAQVIHTDKDKNGSSAPQTTISGGTFKNLSSKTTAWTVRATNAAVGSTKVSGGTFNKNNGLSYYLAEGYLPEGSASKGYTVGGPYEAKIGSTGYKTLAAAITAARSGNTVKLLMNVTVKSGIAVNKKMTLDLNGKTVTGTGTNVFVVNAETTIKNGTIEKTGTNTAAVFAYDKLKFQNTTLTGVADGGPLLSVNYNGNVTIDATSKISAKTGTDYYPAVFIKGQDDDGTTYDPVLNIYGTVECEKGTDAKYAMPAIQGNGTDRGTSHINIFDGALVKSDAVAMYLPQPCEVNITGGTVTGYCGIGIKSGTLNISGGVVSGTANDDVISDRHSSTNGINYDGSAIMIDSYIGYAGQVVINISGSAKVQSSYSTAIREIGNTESKTNMVALNITGGQVLGGSGKDAVLVRDTTASVVAVSGGTFSSPVQEEYCALGFKPTTEAADDGTYTVVKRDDEAAYVDSTGATQYDTLANALTKAKSDTTITLLKEVTYNGSISLVGKNNTIDLNGNNLKADAIFVASGAIIDSKEGVGLVTVSNKALYILGEHANGGYLTIYDAAKSGFRLFKVVSFYSNLATATGGVKLNLAPDFVNTATSGAWDLIKSTNASGVKIGIHLVITKTVGGTTQTTNQDVTFDSQYVDQLCNEPTGSLYVIIKNILTITDGEITSVTATPFIQSATLAEQTGTTHEIPIQK